MTDEPWTSVPVPPGDGNIQPGTSRLPVSPALVRRKATAGRYARAVRRHGWFLLACVVVALAAGVVAVSQMTPVYESVASIQIDAKQDVLPQPFRLLDPGSEIATSIEVLQSRALGERVVDEVGLGLRVLTPRDIRQASVVQQLSLASVRDTATYLFRRAKDHYAVYLDKTDRIIDTVRVGIPATLAGWSFTLSPRPPVEFRVHVEPAPIALEHFQRELSVQRLGRDANIVRLTYRNNDPVVAAAALNSLARQFVERRQSQQTTDARVTAAFLAAQIDTISRELRVAEDTLRAFRERERIVNTDVEGATQVSRLAELKAKRDATEVERNALADLLAELAKAPPQGSTNASPYRRVLGFPEILKNPLASTYLGTLSESERQRADLLMRRTMQDPDVQTLTRRIHDVEEQLRSMAQTYLAGLTEEEATMDAQLAAAGARMSAVPRREVELARLQRQPRVLTDMLGLLQTRLKEAQIAEARQDVAVQMLDPGSVARKPTQPRPVLDVAVAGVVGLLLGLAVAFARDQNDKSLHTREEVSAVTGAAVLTVVPNFKRAAAVSGARRSFTRLIGRSPAKGMGDGTAAAVTSSLPQVLSVSEAYARLNTNIVFPAARRTSFVVTSPLPRDGKTTTAINLAITLARRGEHVVLVDADLRRGDVASRLALSGPGLSDALADETLGALSLVQSINVGRRRSLHVLTAGSNTAASRAQLDSPRMHDLHVGLQASFATIVYDSPPINLVNDAAVLARMTDGALLVARAGVTTAETLELAVDHLRAPYDLVRGVILNDVDPRRDGSSGNAFQYYGAYDA